MIRHRMTAFERASGVMISCILSACAGTETPPIGSSLAEDVAAAYAGGQREAAGGESAPSTPASEPPPAPAQEAPAEPAQLGGRDEPLPPEGAGSEGEGEVPGEEPAPEEPEAEEPSAEPVCDGFAILASSCGTSGCHGAGSNLGTFAASEAEAARYVGVAGTVCSSQGLLLDPEDPSGSLMVTKLSDFPPCGQPMPLGGPLLSDEEVECIEDWIGSL